MERLSVICPCCEAALMIDAQTGAIISHAEKKKVLGSFDDLKGELGKQKELRDALFTQEMSSLKDRERLLEILDEVRAARQSNTVHRDHNQAGRCRACGYRAACDEALD